AADEVGGVVLEDAAQPGQPLGLGSALEPTEPAVRLQERLLDQVGGIDLGLQPALDARPGGEAEVVTAAREEALPGRAVAGAGLGEQVGHAGRLRRTFPTVPLTIIPFPLPPLPL